MIRIPREERENGNAREKHLMCRIVPRAGDTWERAAQVDRGDIDKQARYEAELLESSSILLECRLRIGSGRVVIERHFGEHFLGQRLNLLQVDEVHRTRIDV